MVTAPLFVVVLVITVVALKTKAARSGSVVLGVMLGLTLASTSLGAPLLNAVTAASAGLVNALSSISGA